jgi:hypothetical protein
MVGCIRDLRVQFAAGALPAENVLLEVYSAITEGIENVVVHPALDEMIAPFTVSASGEAFAAKACLRTCGPAGRAPPRPQGGSLGSGWPVATVNAVAREAETSCELMALELAAEGRPVPCG